MLAVREACYAAREDARLWALYGVLCYRARRHEEALHALRQSLWLRERAHDTKRAAVLEKLIAQVELGGSGELSAA
jgi:Flp pilus assembly protein TadD